MNQTIQMLPVEEQMFHPAPVNPEPFTKALAEFLQRADLKGAEVPTFAELWNVVQALQEGELVIVTAAQLQEAKDNTRMGHEANQRLADLEAILSEDEKVQNMVRQGLIKLSRERDAERAGEEVTEG